MANAAELMLLIKADASGMNKGFDDAKAKTGGLLDGLGKLGLAGLGVGVIKGAAEGVAASMGGIIEAAEAAGDAKARLDIVLGSDLSGVMQDNATIANQLGMTKTSYLEAAGAASNYLTNLGVGKDAAADMAMGMTELAPKLAAFTGMDPAAVTDALQKGVGGATRGLKELGIAIDTDLLEGLDGAAESQAIYDQILAQSAGAQQAWADNQGDVANSMARVSAAMDDAKAAIGERLLPIIAPLIEQFATALPGAIDAVVQVGGTIIGWAQQAGQALASFFTDTSAQGQSFKDQLIAAWENIKTAVGRAVDWFDTNVKPVLLAVFQTIASKVAELKQQFDDKFGSIRGFVQSVVDWFNAHVAPTIASVFDQIMAVVGPVVEFFRAHMDEIKAIVSGVFDVVVGVVSGGFTIIKGLFEAAMAFIRGDWSGAWEAIKGTVSGVIPAIGRILGGLWETLRGLGRMALDAAMGIGGSIVDGIRNGLQAKWDAALEWVRGLIAKIPAAARNVLGIKSPSTIFAAIGEQAVEGLRIGLAGLGDLAGLINETLGRIIGDADRENFKSIAELTASLLDIFKNTTDAIKALLSFDVETSAAQISAAFDALVGTFETALLRMKGLAQFAGRGESPIEFLNMFDVQNIEIVAKGIQATISMLDGLLGIVDKMASVKLPRAGGILELLPFLQELGTTAAQFIDSVGTPEGEDATAWFNQGASTTAAIAAWAKAAADIIGLKFGSVAADFRAQMQAAATATREAWAAIADMAAEWGEKGVTERERLLTGVKAYAEVVGAAVGALKAAAELKIDAATLTTRTMMDAAATAAGDAVAAVAAAADWWVRNAEAAGRIVVGVKAYAEAAGAAVGLLRSASDMNLGEATQLTLDDLGPAVSNARLSEVLLRGLADAYITAGEEWRGRVVPAMRDYADAAGAALDLLSKAGAFVLDIKDATKAQTLDALAAAGDLAREALAELTRLAAAYVAMEAEARTALVDGIKGFADAAGTAVDLLVKGAQGLNGLGEIRRLAGVQPRLIGAILSQLKATVDIVAANVPTIDEATKTKLAGFGQLAGVFDPLAKAAQGMNALGEIRRLSGVQPRLIAAILSGVNAAVAAVAAGAGTFAADVVTKVKAWGDAAGASLGALTAAADGLNKLSGKLTIPGDLAARVTVLVEAMRTVVGGMAGALSGEGKIDLDSAKAGADVADAVKRIAESMGPIFDAINGALESPFGRVRAGGQRGDTFRQNIANRIKASLVAAVAAVNDAMKALPPISIPDGIADQLKTLADAFNPLVDLIAKLGDIKSNMRLVPEFAAAVALLGGSFAGGGPGGGGGAPGGQGITINVTTEPTFVPMPVTVTNQNTFPITVGGRVIEAIAVEVANQFDIEVKLKPAGRKR